MRSCDWGNFEFCDTSIKTRITFSAGGVLLQRHVAFFAPSVKCFHFSQSGGSPTARDRSKCVAASTNPKSLCRVCGAGQTPFFGTGASFVAGSHSSQPPIAPPSAPRPKHGPWTAQADCWATSSCALAASPESAGGSSQRSAKPEYLVGGQWARSSARRQHCGQFWPEGRHSTGSHHLAVILEQSCHAHEC